ncbi:MAG: response regulator [Clostridia bacterium]|nr:response regulator [Clostridia bacterium]
MGKRVMIVEDSNTVRYEVKLILEQIGVTLVETANEMGMFNMMEEYGKCVDLIIMDLTLKHENGFDLIEKLKENEKYRDIPILVLTEHADKNNVLKAKELAVAGYLRKPIRKDELIERVKAVLARGAEVM